MATRKRLVLFVEGEGDVIAAPVLVKRLLTELAAWDCLSLDPVPFRMGAASNLFGRSEASWAKSLRFAAKGGNLGGVLLLQDGDITLRGGQPFCARDVGCDLSRRAQMAGAGSIFSVASVFACQEFESLLIAGIESLAGKKLADGRIEIPANLKAPAGKLEQHPRDAKGWLNQNIPAGYKPSTDQVNLRSFRRLESALRQLIEAVRSGKHIVTPAVTTLEG